MPNMPLRSVRVEVGPLYGRGEVIAGCNGGGAGDFYIKIKRDHEEYPTTKSMTGDEFRALRDALIEIYPVETPKPKAEPYTIEPDYNGLATWNVGRREPVMYRENVASRLTEKHAQRIADALNAQETA